MNNHSNFWLCIIEEQPVVLKVTQTRSKCQADNFCKESDPTTDLGLDIPPTGLQYDAVEAHFQKKGVFFSFT